MGLRPGEALLIEAPLSEDGTLPSAWCRDDGQAFDLVDAELHLTWAFGIPRSEKQGRLHTLSSTGHALDIGCELAHHLLHRANVVDHGGTKLARRCPPPLPGLRPIKGESPVSRMDRRALSASMRQLQSLKETVYDHQRWQHRRSKQCGAPEPGDDADVISRIVPGHIGWQRASRPRPPVAQGCCGCPCVQETALGCRQRFALKPEGNESQ
jgi:hypothetical protein